jgi:hypothetical protein
MGRHYVIETADLRASALAERSYWEVADHPSRAL